MIGLSWWFVHRKAGCRAGAAAFAQSMWLRRPTNRRGDVTSYAPTLDQDFSRAGGWRLDVVTELIGSLPLSRIWRSGIHGVEIWFDTHNDLYWKG